MIKRDNIYNIDLNKVYLIPMAKKGLIATLSNSEVVEANIEFDNGTIVIKKDGYETLYSYDFYFNYLLQTGYYKIKD